MSGRMDPTWGDDWMAVADAVGVSRGPEPLHPSVRGHLADEALAATLEDWSADIVDDHFLNPDAPIPFVLTDHTQCDGCDEQICGCEQPCSHLHREACTHSTGKILCPTCADRLCADCKAETARWDYNPESRGGW